jgi:hypothetical protein
MIDLRRHRVREARKVDSGTIDDAAAPPRAGRRVARR